MCVFNVIITCVKSVRLARKLVWVAFVVICCRDVVPWIIAKMILHFGLHFQESDGSENL